MNDQPNKIHSKKRKSYNIEGHAHELTFSCYHHHKYFNDPLCCELFIKELASARDKFQFYLWAYVIMPTHVHLLIYPFRSNYNISIILQSIKGKFSTTYRNILKNTNMELFEKICIQEGKKKVFRFWQAGGGFDRNLWNAKAIHSSIQYIEANPVRAGLVEYPEDWKWSSARARIFSEGQLFLYSCHP